MRIWGALLLLLCSEPSTHGALTWEEAEQFVIAKNSGQSENRSVIMKPLKLPTWKDLENGMFKTRDDWPVIDRNFAIRSLSSHGYMGDVRTLHGAVSGALQRGELVVCIMGGSLPAGYRSFPYGSHWPRKFEDMLNKIVGFKITVINVAFRASPSHDQATFLFRHLRRFIVLADLIIVDISANDRPSSRELRRTAGVTTAEDVPLPYDTAFKLAEGKLLMQLLLLYKKPSAAVLYVDVHTSSSLINPNITTRAELELELSKPPCGDPLRVDECIYVEHQQNYSICPADISTYPHWLPLVQLKIPLIAFSTVVCPYIGVGHDTFWPGLHPPPKHHYFLAQMITAAVFEMAQADLPDYSSPDGPVSDPSHRAMIADWNKYIHDPISKSRQASDADVKAAECAVDPKTYLTATKPIRFKPKLKGAGWRFMEDVPGKPGWVCAEKASSDKVTPPLPNRLNVSTFTLLERDIMFVMQTGLKKPRIMLQLLVSYTSIMGILSCGAYDENGVLTGDKPTLFNTLGADRTSQTAGFDLNVAVPDGKFTSDVKSEIQTFHLLCRADHGKIKLTAVVGC